MCHHNTENDAILSNKACYFYICQGFIYLHYILISPLHLVVGVYLIHRQIGSAAFIVPAFILMIIFMQYLLARGFVKLR